MATFNNPRKTSATATASATLARGFHTPVDATAGPLTMTLPNTAPAGVEISVEKVDSSTNAVTISGTIRGSVSTIPLTTQYEARTFLSDGSGSWRPVSDHRTAASLTATITGQVGPVAQAEAAKVAQPVNEGFLGQIAKAKDGPFRILMCGTSIATFDWSPIQVFTENLKTLYGDAGMFTWRGGILGGSFDTAYAGWKKQRYAGPFYCRVRGEASSSDLVLPAYGDRVTVEFSRETDSEAANIQIDGVTVGTTPSAGAQAYSLKQTFTTTLGPHTVTIKPPTGAGFVYFERLDSYRSDRTGVEVIDGTLGGSTLGMMVQDVAATGNQVTTVPVSGDNGINAWFDRTDVDAFIVQQVVNDAGSAPLGTYFASVYKPTMDKIVAKAATARKPLLLVVEMGGHYSLPNDGGSNARNTQFNQIRDYLLGLKAQNHVTVMDHHAATVMPDLAAYTARYYPAVTGLNVAAGTYTGDFIHAQSGNPGPRVGVDLIHKMLSLPSPRQATASEVRFERMRRLPNSMGKDQRVTISGTAKRYPQAAGLSNQFAVGSSSTGVFVPVPYYRDPSPTNLGTGWQATLDASVNSDQYGKYADMTLANQGLPGTVPWTSGAKRMLTVRASGSITIRAYGIVDLLSPEGTVIPRTDTVNGRTEVNLTVVGSEPVVVSVLVSASGTSGNGLALSGRVYDASLTDSNYPVLTAEAAAGAQGASGSTGPAGGFGSPLSSGLWSMPTVAGSLTTTALVVGEQLLVPFMPLQSGSIDALGIDVRTAATAGGILRCNIYAADPITGRPSGAPLATDLDLATTAVAGVTGTLASSVPVVAGKLYWLSEICQVAVTTVAACSGITPFLLRPGPSMTQGGGYRTTSQTGASPTLTSAFFGASAYGGTIPMLTARAV